MMKNITRTFQHSTGNRTVEFCKTGRGFVSVPPKTTEKELQLTLHTNKHRPAVLVNGRRPRMHDRSRRPDTRTRN